MRRRLQPGWHWCLCDSCTSGCREPTTCTNPSPTFDVVLTAPRSRWSRRWWAGQEQRLRHRWGCREYPATVHLYSLTRLPVAAAPILCSNNTSMALINTVFYYARKAKRLLFLAVSISVSVCLFFREKKLLLRK